MSRRQITLLGLLGASVVLALLLGVETGGGAGDDENGRSPVRARAARRSTADPAVHQVVELRSGPLDDVASQYEPGRDPFRFYEPPRPEPKPAPEPKPEPTPEPVQRVEAPPPEPLGPQPPPIELDFVGSFGPEEQPIAVFTDGEEIYNVRLGDVIDGKFRLIRIGYESVDLAFVDFPDVPAERLPIGRANGG
ncbi:MAG: hypothetical protein PVG07_09420 [Acidobacteriota bacterium]